jgi:hypothetical protein
MKSLSRISTFVAWTAFSLLATVTRADQLPILGQRISIANGELAISFPRVLGADDLFSEPFRLKSAPVDADFGNAFYIGRLFPCGSMFFRCKSDFAAEIQVSYNTLHKLTTPTASPEIALQNLLEVIDRKQADSDQRPLPLGATLVTFGKRAVADRTTLQFARLNSGLWSSEYLRYGDGALAGVNMFRALSPRVYLHVFLKVLEPEQLPRGVSVQQLVDFAKEVAANTNATLIN